MKHKILCKLEKPQRIDKFIMSLELDEIYSRSQVEKLIKDGLVMVNGVAEKKSYEVSSGDKLQIDIPESSLKDYDLIPENIPIEVIYEDAYLTVINKDTGLTVHPAMGNPKGTLVNALLYYYGKELSAGASPERPGIVHRLDKDTSGLLIIARNDEIHSRLSSMFKEREIRKTYLAITCGIPAKESDRIESYITRSRIDRRKMTVAEEGKLAITNYNIKEYFNYLSLLEVGLETGRTHQIRVHMSHLNCPVLADRLYSSSKREANLIPGEMRKRLNAVLKKYAKRQMLHAWKLEFTHPITRQKLKLTAPPKQDFQETLEAIRRAGL